MRVNEFIIEVGNTILPYTKEETSYSVLYKINELALIVEFFIDDSTDIMNIEFTVNDEIQITNRGNQFQILSNVINILTHELPKYKNFLSTVFFIGENKNSRNALYSKRVVPIISKILGSKFVFHKEEQKYDNIYRWIKNASE